MLERHIKKRNVYGKILSTNLKHNFLMPFSSASCILILTISLFNITALQGRMVAQPIEFLMCFVGVMLLTPIFLPEQNKEIRDVICSKKIDYLKVCVIRVLYSVTAIIVLEGIFIGMMRLCESQVTIWHWFGGVATALFLGAIGLAIVGISDNTVSGYMAAFVYYLANYGLKQKLGVFNLFSMYMGSFKEKWWQLVGGIILIIITFCMIKIRQRR